MEPLKLEDRLQILAELGEHLRRDEDELLQAHLKRTAYNNGWLTVDYYRRAIESVATEWLSEQALSKWVSNYPALRESTSVTAPSSEAPNSDFQGAPRSSDLRKSKKIGLVLAGNIPMVGFHDVISVFLSGHIAQIKVSEKDPYVIPYLLKLMTQFSEDRFGKTASIAEYFQLTEKLSDFEAVIATGSNNSARYFEAYFGKYPHIIRRNRNGVAVLSGEETDEELKALGEDIFTYFGLGCRNVAKLYVPQGYDFEPMLNVFHEWRQLQNHPKYKNNFDYHYALLTVNREQFLSNGSVILREDKALLSHIAGLYYEYYTDLADLQIELHEHRDQIQLVVAKPNLLSFDTKYFGEAQRPGLMDYADGVDTVAWLVNLYSKE
ncbi:MAG: acyl-CoA reductase [Bacteroidota bacterium]